jgi:prepilin-type processing-associated H-X9-DG protein
LPALARSKQKAQAIVCVSNLRQWSQVTHMYTSSNDDKIWMDLGHNPNGTWMMALDDLYGKVGQFRLCPVAKKTNALGYGNTFEAWGPYMQAHGFRPQDYGSYGINHWINSLPEGSSGWRGQRDWQFFTLSAMTDPTMTPLFGDCAWYGGNPFDRFPPSLGNGWRPAPTRDWNKTNPQSWDWDMARFCMDRHSKRVNFGFADGSTHSVKLTELWSLKWHKQFRTTNFTAVSWL